MLYTYTYSYEHTALHHRATADTCRQYTRLCGLPNCANQPEQVHTIAYTPAPPPPPAKKASGKLFYTTLLALAAGIAGLFFWGIPLGVAAILIGSLGLSSEHKLRGFALAAIGLGIAAILLAIL